jgi:integrase
MDYYELRHFCATHLLDLGVSHADVAVQLGHTDGGALVMSTYGHPSEDAARSRLKMAYAETVVPMKAAGTSQTGRKAI